MGLLVSRDLACDPAGMFCTSLWRLRTSAIVPGSAPTGFQRWTVKMSESLRGLSSDTTSLGVLRKECRRPSRAPSKRAREDAGGSAPEAADVIHVQLAAALSKYVIWLVRTCAAPTVRRGLPLLISLKSTSWERVVSSGAVGSSRRDRRPAGKIADMGERIGYEEPGYNIVRVVSRTICPEIRQYAA